MPNPFSVPMYAPTIEAVPGQSEMLTPHRMKLRDKHELALSFRFYDDQHPPASAGIRESPIIFKKPDMVDDATSPFASVANLNPQPALPPREPEVAKKKSEKKIVPKKEEILQDEEEQEIHAVSQATTEVSHIPYPTQNVVTTPLSRVERARLLNAGFNQILDEDGHRPFSISATLRDLKIDESIEQKDLRFNDLHLLFMGITFNAELFEHFGGKSKFDNVFLGYLPTSIYFSYQFYNFSYMSTERMHIYTGPLPASKRDVNMAHHRSSPVPPSNKHSRNWSHVSQRSNRSYLPEETEEDEHIWPGILYSYEEDGTPACIFYSKSHINNSR
jgi:hypothetical protein